MEFTKKSTHLIQIKTSGRPQQTEGNLYRDSLNIIGETSSRIQPLPIPWSQCVNGECGYCVSAFHSDLMQNTSMK